MRAGAADVIFHGGEIVPVADGFAPTDAAPEAVAVKDGLIVFVGTLERAIADWQGEGTRLRDLKGRVLLPGFIDPHGHVVGTGLQATIANLLSDPDGDVTDTASIQRKLREFADSDVGLRSKWIIGFGYDDSQLTEERHPTRQELDEVSTERPVLAIHQSFHLGAVNTKGLELLEYSALTCDPEGGAIRRENDAPEHGDPNGVLEETAFFPASDRAIAGLGKIDTAQLLDKGLRAAASFGFTTVQEGAASLAVLDALRALANAEPDRLAADVVVYVKAKEAIDEPDRLRPSNQYTKGLRAAGIKMILDGSPQGRTAWLREPYTTPPGDHGKEYCGYATLTDKVALAQVRAGFKHGWQIIAHVNGDAAVDQLIRSVRIVTQKAEPADRRITAIHCQTAGEDQIEDFRELGIIPSFFSMHTFYWGDWYRDVVLGPLRAADISPAQWALKRGMIYTSHHDAPVALPNSIAILSSQVTRVTRDGYQLGRHQCVSGLDAVKSITINAAYQYGEEATKGSIEVGKLADLVILSANPVTVPPGAIQDITVEETIKEGRTIHPATGPKTAPVLPHDEPILFTHHC
ncbi:amidohydrolase family protein [Embleya sp. NBC_00896]|uniref:amidohydrolase n=1 Tax=Embleya sp. NBC_00896 TaxID=2975961 RepID=UPI002F90A4E6|nr:amidohydrolase family protein [Embleya sp. NBC_00896]